MSRLSQYARIAAGFVPYVHGALTVKQAFDDVAFRVNAREQRFLAAAALLIYSNPNSPFRKLLSHAGCAFGDLESSVHSRGLESTLEQLRDAGVFLSAEEFKSLTPIQRPGLSFETTSQDFDNPTLMGRSIAALTSGSTSRPSRVLYDWNFFSEEAANELLLHQMHGVQHLPQAFWYPALPSISGLHNLLIHLKFRKPPDKWYSQLEGSTTSRMVLRMLAVGGHAFGLRIPFPETRKLDGALDIASWMAAHRPCSLKTFTSSAVRVVREAMEHGLEISGAVVFAGGEPLTELRRSFLEGAGMRVFPRYVTTETGLVGAGCNAGRNGSMHLYTDRLAAIQNKETNGEAANRILFTTLSASSGKILLNVDLGDEATLDTRKCECLFGQAGMHTHLADVRNFTKLTSEGMTVMGASLNAAIGELVAAMGGGPDDYQIREVEGENGLARIAISISPVMKGLDETAFKKALLQRLSRESVGSAIASEFWQQADVIQVIRADPQLTVGYKHFPFIKGKQSGKE